MLDRQRVQTPGVGGTRGDDGAQQITGRERPLLGDTPGLGRTVTVHPADGMDRDGVMLVWPPQHRKAEFPRLTQGWLDAGDNGTGEGQAGIAPPLPGTTQVVKPPPRRGRVAGEVEPTPRPTVTGLPRRWGVERTCAWLGQNRRLSKDDERVCQTRDLMV